MYKQHHKHSSGIYICENTNDLNKLHKKIENRNLENKPLKITVSFNKLNESIYKLLSAYEICKLFVPQEYQVNELIKFIKRKNITRVNFDVFDARAAAVINKTSVCCIEIGTVASQHRICRTLNSVILANPCDAAWLQSLHVYNLRVPAAMISTMDELFHKNHYIQYWDLYEFEYACKHNVLLQIITNNPHILPDSCSPVFAVQGIKNHIYVGKTLDECHSAKAALILLIAGVRRCELLLPKYIYVKILQHLNMPRWIRCEMDRAGKLQFGRW